MLMICSRTAYAVETSDAESPMVSEENKDVSFFFIFSKPDFPLFINKNTVDGGCVSDSRWYDSFIELKRCCCTQELNARGKHECTRLDFWNSECPENTTFVCLNLDNGQVNFECERNY